MPRKPTKTLPGLPKLEVKDETVYTVFFFLFIFLAIFSVFSFLGTGDLPTQYNNFLFAHFGYLSIFTPFWLILVAFVFTGKSKSPFKQSNIFFGFHILFFSLIGLFKQGSLGKFFWESLEPLLSVFPTFLVYLSSSLVGFVILFETSIAQVFKVVGKLLSASYSYTFGKAIKLKPKDQISKGKAEVQYVKDNQVSEKQDKKDDYVAGVKPVLNSPHQEALPLATKPKTASENQAWIYPTIDIFDNNPGKPADRGDVKKNAQVIEQTLDSFGITARIVEINNGPAVTQYALEVALGTKLTKIQSLSNDLAMALAAPGGQIRIEAPIPGRSLVGIELPNRSSEIVPLRKVLESPEFRDSKSKVAVPLGFDVSGKSRIGTISKMPHVLVAGQTGSGKSACLNSWLSSILFRSSPDEVRFIMVDPKRVEFTPYNGIPHLLCPVIVEPEKVVSALKWATQEMDRRLRHFAEVGARNIDSYHEMSGIQSMPYILIVIDELADLMLFAPSEVEDSIVRITQMARAAGIHLVLATQRPSVDVITGLIKANVPTRVAFAVASMTDSRVILDSPGAEKLLGKGDMLYIPPDLAKPVRIQGCWVSEGEITRLVNFIKEQRQPDYDSTVLNQSVSIVTNGKKIQFGDSDSSDEDRDPLFDAAVKCVQETGKASASLLQRRLKLGYARAARVLDELETAGIIGPSNGAKPREIMIPHASENSTE